ncbi:MAG: glycoside hydrolase family 55 protein [Armatimonadetes bacterium]|nr:glycoside hydrolase family 55 protein [Armatimonadota bacterium]
MLRNGAICLIIFATFGLFIPFLAKQPTEAVGVRVGIKEIQRKPMNDAEFYGPFASWLDAKRDFGAKGDGVSDDTEALQRALSAIRPPNAKSSVLFIPSGVYRITKTLMVIREAHSESQHISIIGEDPKTTIIKWDGEKDGIMMQYGAWYARMCRLTFDGAGKAKTAILCGPRFATYNEFTDIIFRDVGFGIEAGRHGTQGIAETVVARSHFVNCSTAGISIQNWNSLDWFIWNCIFDNCRIGVTNSFGAGNYHVYESIFRNSTESDMSMGHAMYFSIRGNLSIGSRSFFRAGWLGACGFVTIQGNFVADTKDIAIEVNNLGPLFLIDNIFRTKFLPVIRVRKDAALLSINNTFAENGAIEAGNNAIFISDRIIGYEKLKVPQIEPPNFPKIEEVPVIDLPPSCNAEDIQNAINKALAMRGKRPIVHLPQGIYAIDRTILIPPYCDLRLVGDGGGNGRGTVLRWVGKEGEPLLKILGPAHARIDSLAIDGSRRADGIVIQGCDQENSRIIADQLNIGGAEKIGLLVEQIKNANLNLFNINHAGCKLAIKVSDAKLTIFCGASSNNELSYDVDNNGSLLVRDIWYETGQYPRFMLLRGSGEFVMHAARVATPQKPYEIPVVEIENFSGKVAFIGTNFVTGDERRTKVLVKGKSNVLLLGCGGDGDTDLLSSAPGNPNVASIFPFRMLPGGGWMHAKGFGVVYEDFLTEMLKLTREVEPIALKPVGENVTDLRLHRVIVGNTKFGVRICR